MPESEIGDQLSTATSGYISECDTKTPFLGLRNANGFRADVVEFVAVRAPENNAEPQRSTTWPQRIQSKTVIPLSFNKLQQAAKSGSGSGGRVDRLICLPKSSARHSA